MNIEVISNPIYKLCVNGNELDLIKRCLEGYGGNFPYMDKQFIIAMIRTIEECIDGKTNL